MTRPSFRLFLFAGCLSFLATAAQLHAGKEELTTNTDMNDDKNGDKWPDGWGKVAEGGSWEAEGSNKFIRIVSNSPGAMVMMYHEVKIPQGVKKLELSWKERVSGLKKGSSPWFDARMMLEFTDDNRSAVLGKPKGPNNGKDTSGWEKRSVEVDVPEGATILKFMPTLFQVESGTYDLDDIEIIGKS